MAAAPSRVVFATRLSWRVAGGDDRSCSQRCHDGRAGGLGSSLWLKVESPSRVIPKERGKLGRSLSE